VKIQVQVFCIVAAWSVAVGYQHFRGPCCWGDSKVLWNVGILLLHYTEDLALNWKTMFTDAIVRLNIILLTVSITISLSSKWPPDNLNCNFRGDYKYSVFGHSRINLPNKDPNIIRRDPENTCPYSVMICEHGFFNPHWFLWFSNRSLELK